MEIQIDKNTIVHRPDRPNRTALKQFYDVLNKINERANKKDLFYTESEVQELKKDSANIFL